MSEYPRHPNNFNNLVNPDFYYNHYTMNVVPNYQEQSQDIYYDPNLWQESYVPVPVNRQQGFPIINHFPYYPPEYSLYYQPTHDFRSVNMPQYQYIIQPNQQQQQQQQQPLQMNVARSELYKTQLCKNFESERSCRYGDMCQFAHGTSDLRQTSKSRNSIYNTNNVNRRFQIEQQNRGMSSNSHSSMTIPSISQPSRPINMTSNNISITSEKSLSNSNSIMDTLSPEGQNINLNDDLLVESLQNMRISNDDNNNDNNNIQVNEIEENNIITNIPNINLTNNSNDNHSASDDDMTQNIRNPTLTSSSSTHKIEINKSTNTLSSSSSLNMLPNTSSIVNNTQNNRNTGNNNFNNNKKSISRKSRKNGKLYNINNQGSNYSDTNMNNSSNVVHDGIDILTDNIANRCHEGGGDEHFVNHDLPETSVWLKRHQY